LVIIFDLAFDNIIDKIFILAEEKGYSRLTKNSNKFNNKWRIYYEDRFDQARSA